MFGRSSSSSWTARKQEDLDSSLSGAKSYSSLGRVLFVKLFLLLAFFGIAARLVKVQIIEQSKYQAMARRQYEHRILLPATRGSIYDCKGNLLASNTVFVSFGIDPRAVEGEEQHVARTLSKIFSQPAEIYLQRLRSPKRFVWIERHVAPSDDGKVKAMESAKIDGLIEIEEPKRLYHYNSLAGQVIGFTNIDNRGIAGIELEYDSLLSGRDGFVVLQRDGLGHTLPSVDYPRVDPQSGRSLVLTIDLAYQSIAEEELREGVKRFSAESGIVLMMRPATGEILALAQFPPVNPNAPASVPVAETKIRAVTDQFEPGSTFKIVTAAAALEHGVQKPGDWIFAENGVYRARARVIRDAHPFGWITFRQAMQYSSNIAMAKVSDRIGVERFYRMVRAFGFGTPTGVDLPGEVSGELKHPAQWSVTTLNTMAYGYEIAATPLQLAAAYSAIANHGILMRPYIVKAVLNNHGDTIIERKPQAIRRVVRKATADTLISFLRGVVEEGTGDSARISGVAIAGKTGTSRKYIDGRYQAGKYTASFVGFLPAEDPQLLCLIMLDNPMFGSYYGGQTSAPIFRSIVERILNTVSPLNTVPQTTVRMEQVIQKRVIVPDVRHLRVDVAMKLLSDRCLVAEVHQETDSKRIIQQIPEPGQQVAAGSIVQLFTVREGERPSMAQLSQIVVPNVCGLSVRRAVSRLHLSGFRVKIEGTGEVTGQVPRASESVPVGSEVVLHCLPRRQQTRLWRSAL